MVTRAYVFLVFAGITVGCKPDLTDRLTLVDIPRIVAIQSQPTKAAPKAPVTLTALLVNPNGTVTATIDWAFCNQPKPLAELGTVSPLCLETQGTWFTERGQGNPSARDRARTSRVGSLGPWFRWPSQDSPPGRPVNPDTTSRIISPFVFGHPRTISLRSARRGLCAASPAGARIRNTQFSKQYLPNANPAILSLTAGGTRSRTTLPTREPPTRSRRAARWRSKSRGRLVQPHVPRRAAATASAVPIQ